MDSSRIAQIYGYVVCLIAIVTVLIAGSRVVDATFDRVSPLHSQDYRYGPFDHSLTSFESFRASYPTDRPMRPTRTGLEPAEPGDTLTTAELRERYETLRTERIERVRFGAMQQLVKNGLLLLLAAALFATHWRWVRGRDGSGPGRGDTSSR